MSANSHGIRRRSPGGPRPRGRRPGRPCASRASRSGSATSRPSTGIDLEIADGEFFSMLGPSGSGKTTTLRMIAGFELPTAGRVLLHGHDVTAPRAVRARREHRVPGLRAVPAHDRRGERRLRAAGAQGAQVRARDARRRGAPDGPARGLRQAQAGPALGRPAAAGRPRARAREPATGAAPRRAAGGARPQAPRGDAAGAQADPARGRHHVHLRDPRPGGGADDERPDRGVQPRPDRAGRRPCRGLRATRDEVRRRVRRHVQPHRRRGRGRHHRDARACSPSAPRRSGSPIRRRPSATTSTGRAAASGASSTSVPTRATTSRSTPARSSSSPSRTWRRPRPRRSPSRGGLSA